MTKIRNLWINFSVWFDALPQKVKALIYNVLAFVLSNAGLILLGKEDFKTAVATGVASVGVFLTYLSNSIGSRAS